MGRRPQPNRRRGLLRAAAAVVGLIILLIIVVTVVSSLTAPTVKAPTVPPTVGPISRTPGTPPAPKPVPSGTAGANHKHVALGSIMLNEHTGSAVYGAVFRNSFREVSPAMQPRGHVVAYFGREGTAYQHVPLLMRYGAWAHRVGYGDRFVRPVWSPDGHHLLYVRVRARSGIPGAQWTLMRWDQRVNGSSAVATVTALALTPLGWRHGRPLYSVAQSTATNVYTVDAGRSRLLGTVLAQPLVDMALSPNGRYLAFGAPDNCAHCTLDIFDLNRGVVWAGPTGMPSASALAWNRDGTLLVGDMGVRVSLINPTDHAIRYAPAPVRLPHRWPDIMRATLGDSGVSLRDTVTGQVYADYGTAR